MYAMIRKVCMKSVPFVIGGTTAKIDVVYGAEDARTSELAHSFSLLVVLRQDGLSFG